MRPALPNSTASTTLGGRRTSAATSVESCRPTFQNVTAISATSMAAAPRCPSAASTRCIQLSLVSRGTSLPSNGFTSPGVTGAIAAAIRTGTSARLKSEPAMASPAGFTLIAPKPRTVAVSLPDNPSELTLALESCADTGATASSRPAAASAAAATAARNLPLPSAGRLTLPAPCAG